MNLESLRREVTSDLEFASREIDPAELSDFVEFVESMLLTKAQATLLALLHEQFPIARVARDQQTIDLEGVIYRLDIGEIPAPVRSRIRITLRPAISGRSPMTNVQQRIGGDGHFTGLSLSVPTSLECDVETLALAVQTVYESGYRWLLEFCRSSFTRMTDSLSAELYGYLRRLFAELQNPALADLAYLGIIDSTNVKYIFDPITADRVISTLQDEKRRRPLSAAFLASELLTTGIDFAKSFNRQAIEAGGVIHVDLADAQYLEDEPVYDIAEQALLGTKGVSFLPLAASNNGFLTCWFPTSSSEELIPVLTQHKLQFRDIFVKHNSKIRALWKSAQKTFNLDFITTLTGKFSAEFVKEWFHIH